MSRRTDASSPSGGIQTATGTYTGDGNATQGIAGVGFQPRFIIIYPHEQLATGNSPISLRNDQDGLNALLYWSGGRWFRYQIDEIISLDVDGFTVGDGSTWVQNSSNELNMVYSYACFR